MASEENKDGSRSPVSAASLRPDMAMPSVPCNGVPNCEPSLLPDAVDVHLHGEMLWEELRRVKVAVGFEALASDMVKDTGNVEHTNKDKLKDKETGKDMDKDKDEVEDKKKEKDKEKDDVKVKDKAKEKEKDKEKEKVKDKQKVKGKDKVFDKRQETVKEKDEDKDKEMAKVMEKDKGKDNVEDCRKRKLTALLGDSQGTEKSPLDFERAFEAVDRSEGPKLCALQTSPTTRTENIVLGPPSVHTNGVQNLGVKVSGNLQAGEVFPRSKDPKIPPRTFGGTTDLGPGKEISMKRVSQDQGVFSFDPLEASSPELVSADKRTDRASGGAAKYTSKKNECPVEKPACRAGPHPEQLGLHVFKDCIPTHESIPLQAEAAATTNATKSNQELNGLRSESKCEESLVNLRLSRSVSSCPYFVAHPSQSHEKFGRRCFQFQCLNSGLAHCCTLVLFRYRITE